MELKNKMPFIIDNIKGHKNLINTNEAIFEILEGDLQKYLTRSLQQQLGEKTLERALHRSSPINVLKKIVAKLSSLYITPPTRVVAGDNKQDQELVDWYSHELNVNRYWNDANKSFNAYKSFALELYESEGYLRTRSLPMHSSMPFSSDSVNPMNVTEFSKIMPYKDNELKFWTYSATEFIATDSKGETINADMAESEGVNPYGVLPIVYGSKSRYLLIPIADTDTIRLTLLIPILLTDLNFASMYLSTPLIWTKNVNGSNFELNPNTYIDLQSSDPEKDADIGVLKPEPNIEAQLTLIKEQLALWLQSKNIKPGAIGSLTVENAASGISLMIQEMDTTEDRKNQIPAFKEAEQDYWFKLATMHNYLAKNDKNFVNRKVFSDPSKLRVDVKYAEQRIIESQADKIDRLAKQVEAGLISRKGAIKELYPDVDEEALKSIIAEIDEERESFVVNSVEEE